MLDQFRKSLLRELDYRQEANNCSRCANSSKDFERIVVPEPIADYSTSRVLTMEYVHGKKVTELSPLARMEFDGDALAEELSALISSRFWSTASFTPIRIRATFS